MAPFAFFSSKSAFFQRLALSPLLIGVLFAISGKEISKIYEKRPKKGRLNEGKQQYGGIYKPGRG
jgi:hypothetical protein